MSPTRSAAPDPDGVFGADWLRLREPVDHRSRAEGHLPVLAEEWRRRGWSRIVDLGSGTGSNARYLAPRLPGAQQWTLVDHDADLLAHPEGILLIVLTGSGAVFVLHELMMAGMWRILSDRLNFNPRLLTTKEHDGT